VNEQSERVLFDLVRYGNQQERDRAQELLVVRHSGLVRWLVRRYVNAAVDRDDLEQVGFLALVMAIQRFDPDRGNPFATFARPTIQGEMQRYFRDKRRWIRLPRRLQETKAMLGTATERLTQQLGRAPGVPELAAALGLDEELVLEAMTADDVFAPLSLDSPMLDDGDAPTLAEVLGRPEAGFELVENRRVLAPLLAGLDDRDRRILQLRFCQGMTQAEIGARVGLSQIHTSRSISRILTGLRLQLTAD
jgi:RNA polymerase sigma-B factor